MINQTVNAYKFPNDINWIKAHLLNHVDVAIEEIRRKLVYVVDKNGNVIFNKNVSINGDNVNYNINQLFEDVKNLKSAISNIDELNNIQSILVQLESVRDSIQALGNNLIGITRDGYEMITHINDDVEVHNNVKIDKVGYATASVIGYGGKIGLNSHNTAIKCVHKYKDGDEEKTITTEWHPPSGKEEETQTMFDVKSLFMFSFLQGVEQSGKLHFAHVKGGLDFDIMEGVNEDYGLSLTFDDGECDINATGMSLLVRISKGSRFLRGKFDVTNETSETITIPQEHYLVNSSDQTIKLYTTDIKYNSLTKQIESRSHPVIYVESDDCAFNISNANDEERGYSTITFHTANRTSEGTYLNAYVPSGDSGPNHDEKIAFEQLFDVNVDDRDDFWSNLVSTGAKLQEEPTENKNAVEFEGNANIKFGTNDSFVVYNNESTPFIQANNDNGMKLNQANSIKFKSTNTVAPEITFGNAVNPGASGQLFKFNNDAEFTYKVNDTETKTVKISELMAGESEVIKQLENRIITLERNNWYSTSSMTDADVFKPEPISDAEVITKYYTVDDEHKQQHNSTI